MDVHHMVTTEWKVKPSEVGRGGSGCSDYAFNY